MIEELVFKQCFQYVSPTKYLVIAEVFAKHELVDSNCCEVHSVLSIMLTMLGFRHLFIQQFIQEISCELYLLGARRLTLVIIQNGKIIASITV